MWVLKLNSGLLEEQQSALDSCWTISLALYWSLTVYFVFRLKEIYSGVCLWAVMSLNAICNCLYEPWVLWSRALPRECEPGSLILLCRSSAFVVAEWLHSCPPVRQAGLGIPSLGFWPLCSDWVEAMYSWNSWVRKRWLSWVHELVLSGFINFNFFLPVAHVFEMASGCHPWVVWQVHHEYFLVRWILAAVHWLLQQETSWVC